MTEELDAALIALGHNPRKYTGGEATAVRLLAERFAASPLSLEQRLAAFPKYVRRQDLARFLAKYELFKHVLPVAGSVVECGVYLGAGLMSWYHFSAILEPYNHTRRIVGFDTFAGFPQLSKNDMPNVEATKHHGPGAFAGPSGLADEIESLVLIHDMNRPLGHIPKVQCVCGDALVTIPDFVARNPHFLISLLYLDFDLYEPTKAALVHLMPRVAKGGIVAFDEANCEEWPGETKALLEVVGPVQLRRTHLDPYISWFIR